MKKLMILICFLTSIHHQITTRHDSGNRTFLDNYDQKMAFAQFKQECRNIEEKEKLKAAQEQKAAKLTELTLQKENTENSNFYTNLAFLSSIVLHFIINNTQ